MRYCCTSLCNDTCVCRAVANKLEISEVISDPNNHAMERRQLMELLAERRRLKNEAHLLGLDT